MGVTINKDNNNRTTALECEGASEGGGSVVIDLLLYVPPIVCGVLYWSCYGIHYFVSFLVLQSSVRGRGLVT